MMKSPKISQSIIKADGSTNFWTYVSMFGRTCVVTCISDHETKTYWCYTSYPKQSNTSRKMKSWRAQESHQAILDLFLALRCMMTFICCVFSFFIYASVRVFLFQSHISAIYVSVTNCLSYPQINVKVWTPHEYYKFPCSKVLTNIEGGL